MEALAARHAARRTILVRAALAALLTGRRERNAADAVGQLLLDRDRGELSLAYLPVVRRLVREGFLSAASTTL